MAIDAVTVKVPRTLDSGIYIREWKMVGDERLELPTSSV